MSEHIKAWQCIGCGRIEAPQNCIGICQDRKVEFVYAFEYEDALAQLELAQWANECSFGTGAPTCIDQAAHA